MNSGNRWARASATGGLLVLSLVAGLLPRPCRAAAGDLDTTFGNQGKVLTSLDGGIDLAYAVAIQPDGKIIVAGHDTAGMAAVRYKTDGTLDATFGVGGKVDLPGYSTAEAHAVVVRPNGKILLAGYVNTDSQVFALFSLNPDGTLNADFGTKGHVFIKPGGFSGVADAMYLQPDGRILLAGVGGDFQNSFAAARLNVDGTLDQNFGLDGSVLVPFERDGAVAHAVTVAADGKIILAGQAWLNGHTEFALVRLLPNGSLDTTFGEAGKVHALSMVHSFATSVLIQGNGKIVAAGGADNAALTTPCFLAMRFTPDGSLDPGFGTSGKQLGSTSTPGQANGIAYIKEGKFILAGNGGDNFHLQRWNANGALDTSFGRQGDVNTAFEVTSAWVNATAVQPDGKIVCAGPAYMSTGHTDFALARYDGGLTDLSPSVTSFTPSAGAIADPLTVFGYNFTGATAVTIGATSKAQTFKILDSNRIRIDSLAPGTESGKIRVTTPKGTAASTADFHLLPKITSFTPASGAMGGTVTITGTGFRLSTGDNVTAVRFSGASGTFITGTNLAVLSKSQLTVKVPAGANTGPLRIKNEFGATQSADSFTVTPGISSPAPPSGRSARNLLKDSDHGMG